ncbi:receptor-like protein kinase 7 [Humulus lupulus]|uniref:receptor-like protein kinase 7 n=1 Tax=Humulus lupulus TaxID=3486 RepID=UPI002B40FC3D|nr:receptor-like protein kinase 7 [Humulus lupulus]
MSLAQLGCRSWLERSPMVVTMTMTLFYLSLLVSLTKGADYNELQPLLKFKSVFEKSNTALFSSWIEDANSICNFTGIRCNSNGLVSEINLPAKNLSGVLPFDSICSLRSLEKISLGSNSLHGIVSDALKNCTRLKHLDLGVNSFSGKVPDLSTLKELTYLNLNLSGFSGLFPWKSLENLTNLSFLSIGDNPFDSTPFPSEILKLEKLYFLYLTNSSLYGKFPEDIGNLTLLINLELSDNRISGEIPASISKLQNLWQLELYNNSLSGKLPKGFGNLTNLVNFDASTNMLEGDLSELRSLTKLESLQLFENQLEGTIPEELGEFKNLHGLSLYRNKLTGMIPQKIGSWSGMDFIDVSENSLTGPIPPDMCKNGYMFDLLVLQNKLTGGIPESYGNCKSLSRLLVNNNSLSGMIPDGIWSLPNLERIDLSMNQFEGSMGSGIAQAKSLGQLVLANNRFSGELPDEISEASSLVEIQLSGNQFSGKIPEPIGKLSKLSNLYLDNNHFSGSIPESLGSCRFISQINLAHNSLSGNIPDSIGYLPNLNALNLSENQLSGEIPNTLSSLKLSLLDLSNNKLTGQVPESLSVGAFKDSFNGNPGLCFDNCSSNHRDSGHFRTYMTCLIAVVLVLLISLACFLVHKLRKNQKTLSRPLKQNSWNMKPYHVLSFTEKEIIDSVKPENLIGKGGSGTVYKVSLKDGKEVAVKHIWAATSDPNERRSYRSTAAMLKKSKSRSPEYDAEVAALSSVRHVNVVKLYCSISSEDSNLLVYEYLPNGSLWDRLHTCQKMKMEMGWEVRYEVAVGAAKGLEYLHHGCQRPVIHRDVKSSNILLDQNWKPRIADFGLAKIVQTGGDWTHVIAGTLGYIAPEYAYTYKINEKSDVYSFGVVLMELVTGKRPVEPEFGENKDIVHWVYSKFKSQESVIDLVDSTISDAQKEDALKVLKIAVHCASQVPTLRPSMRAVVQMLEEAQPCQLTSISVVKEGENSHGQLNNGTKMMLEKPNY